MIKYNKKHKDASEPMKVLISKESEDVLRKKFYDNLPQTLRYTMPDLQALNLLFTVSDEIKDVDELDLAMFVRNNTLYYADNERECFNRFYNKRNTRRYGRIFTLMYELPIEKVPLYINDPLLALVAKWRLDLNK